MPEDFRKYLLRCAPEEIFWDAEDTIWWPPDRVKNIPDEYEYPTGNPLISQKKAPTYLFFADFMIWCCAWAICCEEGPDRGKVAVIGGHPDHFVADSFTEFVIAYVADPHSAY